MGAEDSGSVPRWLIWAVVLGATAALWYTWPSIGSGSPDVAAIGRTELRAAQADIAYQVRDRGRAFHWIATADTWCDVADVLSEQPLDPGVGILVVAVDGVGDCGGDPLGDVRSRLADLDVNPVVVVLPGTSEVPDVDDARVVRTESLLGEVGTVAMPCEWWDECPPTGLVEIRMPDGALTLAGHDRIGRMIAAVIA